MPWEDDTDSMISKWRIFKVSILLTPYDRLLNNDKSNQLATLAVTISNTKCSGNNIVDEEWMNFYTVNDGFYEIHLYEQKFEIYYVTKRKQVQIKDLLVLKASNIRIQVKDTTIQVKYYLEWEIRMQITFYSCEEAIDFKSKFNDLLKRSFNEYQNFISQMNKLNCDVENIDPEKMKTTKTLPDLLNEYRNLINK